MANNIPPGYEPNSFYVSQLPTERDPFKLPEEFTTIERIKNVFWGVFCQLTSVFHLPARFAYHICKNEMK